MAPGSQPSPQASNRQQQPDDRLGAQQQPFAAFSAGASQLTRWETTLASARNERASLGGVAASKPSTAARFQGGAGGEAEGDAPWSEKHAPRSAEELLLSVSKKKAQELREWMERQMGGDSGRAGPSGLLILTGEASAE